VTFNGGVEIGGSFSQEQLLVSAVVAMGGAKA